MKTLLFSCAVMLSVLPSSLRAEEEPSPTPASKPTSLPAGMPLGMKGSYETVEATIEKVYSAENDGFRYEAYLVKWHDQEVVIPNMLGTSDKKAGDKITFMAQQLELPMMGKSMKMLQFMAMDSDAMKKLTADFMKSSGTTSASPSDTNSPSPQATPR